MTKLIVRAAAVVALAASFQAAPAAAAPFAEPDLPGIVVVNNHAYRVTAIVVDRDGKHHRLGRVGASRVAEFDLAAIELEGPAQVKVIVDEPAWSAGNTGEAVRTLPLELAALASIKVWVEPELENTTVQVVR